MGGRKKTSGDLTFHCGYCLGASTGRPHVDSWGRKGIKRVSRFFSFSDLIEHIINYHRFRYENGRLVRR